ncbi:MAG: hypothetical protein O3B01_19270 [Planctomycetota bacterium]|nr:hypothetical protein [Planctomycetota bacterium]MDA1140712.1 hypothetical protein [Planctomycetota bacterium]
MTPDLQIKFPSEAEQLCRRVAEEKHLTPGQRIRAVCDALDAAERLSLSGGQRSHQLAYHQRCEEEWQQMMKEFIARHVES